MINENQDSFGTYGLSDDILESLRLLGYERPTEIQQQVIPAMLEGKNVVGRAPTGSGKTAAFAIPICDKIIWEENLQQALILEPTRELMVQVQEEVFHIGRKKRLKVPAVFGGFPIDKQIRSLKQKSHIVTGTPGRVMDHIRRGSLILDKVSCLVIDEADLMLDMGFIDEVKQILDLLSPECRIALFSATLKPEIREFAGSHIHDMVMIFTEQPEAAENAITEELFETDNENKFKVFLNVLYRENPQCCIIFCGTREMVNVLFQKLRRHRIFCGMIHGELEQKERLKTIDAFRRGAVRYLIATDVAARGIDLENITHVINYDFPTGRETYVHRIGRTGRNGRTGKAVSLVMAEDRRMLQMTEEYTGRSLPVLVCPESSGEEEKNFWKSQRLKTEAKPSKRAALNQDIIRLSIGGGRKSKMRPGDIVGTLCSIDGIEVSDIGIIDVRESLTYVEILNGKGSHVLESLQDKPIKGKIRKVRTTRGGI